MSIQIPTSVGLGFATSATLAFRPWGPWGPWAARGPPGVHGVHGPMLEYRPTGNIREYQGISQYIVRSSVHTTNMMHCHCRETNFGARVVPCGS